MPRLGESKVCKPPLPGMMNNEKNIFDIITLKDFAEDFGGADGVDGVEMI